jgi:hypothetical protein
MATRYIIHTDLLDDYQASQFKAMLTQMDEMGCVVVEDD